MDNMILQISIGYFKIILIKHIHKFLNASCDSLVFNRCFSNLLIKNFFFSNFCLRSSLARTLVSLIKKCKQIHEKDLSTLCVFSPYPRETRIKIVLRKESQAEKHHNNA